MEKPKKIKLGWKIFTIKYESHVISNGSDCFGKADYNKNEIFISEDSYNGDNQKIPGLLHELMHMIDIHYETQLSEAQISRLTTGIGDVAAQNPGLIKYIFEEI